MWCLRANPAITGWRQLLGVAALNRFAELPHHGGKLKQRLIDTVTNLSIDDLCLADKELCAPSGKPPSVGGDGSLPIVVDFGLPLVFEARFGRQNIIPISMPNGGSSAMSIVQVSIVSRA
jgi:galactokinase/mevalonate kinase-like predicted kinase